VSIAEVIYLPLQPTLQSQIEHPGIWLSFEPAMLRFLNASIVLAWYGFVVVGSLILLVRIAKGHSRITRGQLGVLSEKWQRWMLGESTPKR